ncbi:IclR family transcriptional regulator domain-containing protein [Streptomyces broussonetiae]|uniref:Helix-turn-helix domain-containing protein n=1 Tax=Streptomyces broussonetiae TaxID=2686304 RepID=A0A6I6N3E8_9ACTN|nr:IclR family transcriptional regulator C-terminal domain-containing protein [Streptomyces broussonetiae]QHA07243.1 helix-turn-helix domain-containing protein [Streptomyces broussonetiae]
MSITAQHTTTRRIGITRRTGGTSHAERVFRVQQAFAQLGGGAQGLAELARASGIDDSAVHRILRSGVEHGTFLQVGRGRYRLGPQAAQLGIEALEHALDDEALRACLDRLREAADGALVFLYGLSYFGGVQRQCVEMAVGCSDLSEIGLTPRELMFSHRSLRIGASGRTILAHLPEAVQRKVATERIPDGMGPGAYRDGDRMLASLPGIRARGYAVGLQECAAGWDSFAAPVFWGDLVVGAVTLLTPGTLTLPECRPYSAAVCTAAHEVQRLVLAPETEGVTAKSA